MVAGVAAVVAAGALLVVVAVMGEAGHNPPADEVVREMHTPIAVLGWPAAVQSFKPVR